MKNKVTVQIVPSGLIKLVWKNKDGLIHRDNDLPAIMYSDGTKEWFKNGVPHRDDENKPAISFSNGKNFYLKDGAWV